MNISNNRYVEKVKIKENMKISESNNRYERTAGLLVIFKFYKSDLEMCSLRMFILTSAIFIISKGEVFAISSKRTPKPRSHASPKLSPATTN